MAELDSGGGRNSNNNGRRMIKCYCNDDLQCPPSQQQQQQQQQQPQSQQFQKSRSQSSQSQSQWSVSDASQYENLASFMSRRGGDKSPPRYCQTSTMCMTKRLQKQNGETWLKYSCDQSHPESIKGAIIEYRDCLVRTQSAADRDYVVKNSAEFCCNHEDFCNVDLAPNVAVKDLVDFADNLNTPNHPSEYDGGSGASAHHHTPSPFFKPANLILSGLSFVVFLVVIVLFILYLYKKAKLKKDSVSDGESKLKPKLPAGGAHVKKPIYQAPGSVAGGSTVATVVGTSSASCSPYSTTASSTTNTSIMPSKESSVNEAAPPSVLIAGPGNRLKMYEHNNAPLDEAFEPLLPLHQANTSLDDNTVIKLNSPLSSTSGGFNGTTTSSTTGGTSSTATSSTGTSTSNSTTHTSASQSEFEWSGSGSGAGVPQCVQRTIARQIKLIYPCIGKGRFGEVYKGVWRGELVAVKTFNSADERSWENECQIYQTQGFRHENILGFIAADNIDRGLYTELWLITEFHPNGSLFDYLTGNKIGTDTMLKMALSVVNGLVHLHMPIESCKGKPALAHCDLKSKNILVKADLTCCIGDLGLALSGDKEGRLIAPPSGQVRTGTKRYMAPEILSKEIDTRYLAPFQMAEIYSLALIFWELLRACRFEDEQSRGTWHELEYKLPYFEYLGAFDPDESMMRQLVCEQHLRPGMSPTWRNHNALVRDFAALTEELWVDHPNERQNALRIKKSIMKINKTFSPNVNSNNTNNTNINNINNNLNGPI